MRRQAARACPNHGPKRCGHLALDFVLSVMPTPWTTRYGVSFLIINSFPSPPLHTDVGRTCAKRKKTRIIGEHWVSLARPMRAGSGEEQESRFFLSISHTACRVLEGDANERT
jgi:hypothetical protein